MTWTLLALALQCLHPTGSALRAFDQFTEAGVELLARCFQAHPVQLKLPLPEPCPDLEALAYCKSGTAEPAKRISA